MRILQVIASLAPRYGGPSVACPALCRELARSGHDVSIYTTNADGDQCLDVPLSRPVVKEGVQVFYFPRWALSQEYKLSLPLAQVLREKIPGVDLVHIYSMYIFSATAAAHFCRKFRVPYLLHPHGTLDPYLLRRHAVRKRLYAALFEKRNFRHAAAILFNSAEEERLAQNWLEKLPAQHRSQTPTRVVVPVGVEEEWLEPATPEARLDFYQKFPELSGRRVVLFFGRLNFKKGMDILAQAFVQVAREQGGVHLLVAGPDTEGFGAKLREWLQAGGVLEKATFTGALSGADRMAAMQQAEVFVLPSYSENFGQSVAEAMACGVPAVISDRVNIWPEVKAAGAGLVVRCDPQETAEAILKLLANPVLAREMGARGRRWVEDNLTWKAVGEQMVRVYEEIVRGKFAREAFRQPLRAPTGW